MKKLISIVLNPFTNDSRVLKESILLKNMGFDVTVIALHQEGLIEKETVQGFGVHRVRLSTRNWPKKRIVQLVKLLEFAIRVIVGYRKVDIVHCNDLGPLPIAVIMKWLSGGRMKVVYDAHEFETEQEQNPNPTLHAIESWAEKFFIRHCDKTITVSDGIAREYAKRYNIPKPALVLNCPGYKTIEKGDKFREKFGISKDKVIFLYQGGLGKGRGIEALLEAFIRFKREDAVLVVMGYGPLQKQVLDATEKSNKIFYHEAVSPVELLTYTASADVGIMTYENICLNHYYCLPNKFFEYAMAGLPILINDLPEMRRLIEEYQCGQVAEGETPEAIMEALEKILDADLSRYAQNSLKMAKDYNWESQEKVLMQLYKELV